MNIEQKTANPSRYADEPEYWELEEIQEREQEQWRQQSTEKYWIEAELYWKKDIGIHLRTSERKNAAQVVSSTIGKKMEFHRDGDYYAIGEWTVTKSSVSSEVFSIDKRMQSLNVLAALDRAGYRVCDELSIYFRPKSIERSWTYVLASMAEKELKRLQEILGLSDEPYICFGARKIELVLPLSRLQHDKLNSSLLLFSQMIQMSKRIHENAAAG